MSNSRPTIEGITITIEAGKVVPVDKSVHAIFFTDLAVNDILAPYYDAHPGTWNKADAEATFGKKIADEIFGSNTSITITGDVIKQLWNAENEDGKKVAFISKTPPCIPG
jgi:hypothetical protein